MPKKFIFKSGLYQKNNCKIENKYLFFVLVPYIQKFFKLEKISNC